MAIFIPALSENALMTRMLHNGDAVLHLYTNAVNTANDALTVLDFTEMAGLGYAAKSLLAANWTVAQNASLAAAGTQPVQTWTFSAGAAVTVQGYYVTDALSGALLWYEPFAAPKVMQNAGDQIIITPTITGARV